MRQLQLGIEWRERTGEDLKTILSRISSHTSVAIGREASFVKTETGARIARRRFRRKSCETHVDVIMGYATFRAKSHSLSRGGMGFFSSEECQPGTRLTIQYANSEVVATVQNCMETDEGWIIGVEFLPSTVDDVLAQEWFMRELLFRPARPRTL